MKASVKQQIVISGVGGQGVLFVTRLLAEAAIRKGLPVLTSETHGMAQRGGTVVSHLKVGAFSSPLIRPGQADGLLALKAETTVQFKAFLKTDAWAVVNGDAGISLPPTVSSFAVDGESLACKIGNPRAVNLVMLGFALSRKLLSAPGAAAFLCDIEDIKTLLKQTAMQKPGLLESSLQALETGYNEK